jgi:hypothetical protein
MPKSPVKHQRMDSNILIAFLSRVNKSLFLIFQKNVKIDAIKSITRVLMK